MKRFVFFFSSISFDDQDFPAKLPTQTDLVGVEDDEDDDDEQSAQTADTYLDYMPLKREIFLQLFFSTRFFIFIQFDSAIDIPIRSSKLRHWHQSNYQIYIIN